MDDLDQKLNDLRALIDAEDDGNVHCAGAALADLLVDRTPRLLRELMRFFDDAEPYHELMWSFVHTVESWDTDEYLQALVEVVTDLWSNAPYWTEMLHGRVLNSPPWLARYLELLDNAGPEVRATVLTVYEAVAARWPALADKTTPVLERLRKVR